MFKKYQENVQIISLVEVKIETKYFVNVRKVRFYFRDLNKSLYIFKDKNLFNPKIKNYKL